MIFEFAIGAPEESRNEENGPNQRLSKSVGGHWQNYSEFLIEKNNQKSCYLLIVFHNS